MISVEYHSFFYNENDNIEVYKNLVKSKLTNNEKNTKSLYLIRGTNNVVGCCSSWSNDLFNDFYRIEDLINNRFELFINCTIEQRIYNI